MYNEQQNNENTDIWICDVITVIQRASYDYRQMGELWTLGELWTVQNFHFEQYFCHLKDNLVVNTEVKGYLQSVICFKRSFIRLHPMVS